MHVVTVKPSLKKLYSEKFTSGLLENVDKLAVTLSLNLTMYKLTINVL